MYITNSTDLEKAIRFLKTVKLIGLDTETNGLDPHNTQVLLISFGNENRQFVLDVAKLGTHIYKALDILKQDNIVKVLHNAKFDYEMIKTNFDIELKEMRDTLLADHLLSQGKNVKKHSLDVTLEKYMGIKVSKELQTSFQDMNFGDEFSENQIDYSAEDVKHLIPLYKKLYKLLSSRQMTNLANLEFNTIEATAALELNGIYIDKEKWLTLKTIAQKNMNTAKKELNEFFEPHCGKNMFGEPEINYNSPKQLLEKLPLICGVPITSTSEAVLKTIEHGVINKLFEYRKHTKKITTYGEEFLNKYINNVTGRIHSNFWQLGGTDSGRYASSNPNLQNIPREAEYRAAFSAPDEDYKMIAADFSGQELRLLTHLSQEPNFISCLNKGKDLHSYCASILFNRNYETITKEERNAAKSLNFGIIYGMGPKRLADTLKISFEAAKNLLQKYFETFPRIKLLLNEFTENALKNKYALSPLDNRRRDLSTFDFDNGREKNHALNISKNLPFQGAGASVTKRALWKVQNKLNNNNALLVNVIHDIDKTSWINQDNMLETP
jgi:DNA polymerase I-like protein with 3'-5' exonuclease and polymerase domains